MRMYSLSPPVLEIDYEELMALDAPDAVMAAFMADAVSAYVSWLSED